MDWNRIEHLIVWRFNYYTKFIANGVYTIPGIVARVIVIVVAGMFFYNEYQQHKHK